MMHVDLNSCFASIEQQARPLTRNKPVVIVNRKILNTAIVAASYEAKKQGAKVGMHFSEVKKLIPGVIPIESDPAKYRQVYKKLVGILSSYSPAVYMKSIDEGVIDFDRSTEEIKSRSLEEIAKEIKVRLKNEVGDYIKCNIGIGTNAFLAKLASGLNKPDGLNTINHKNLHDVYRRIKLEDMTGIAKQNRKRLEAVGIYTPNEFLNAKLETLNVLVFKGKSGDDWYKRLRGYEVDNFLSDMKTCGRQFVLPPKITELDDIRNRLKNLSESVGFRVRNNNMQARGVEIYAKLKSGIYWKNKQMLPYSFYSNTAIWNIASELFEHVPNDGIIREIGITCYGLVNDFESKQLSIFSDELARENSVVEVVDEINQKWGERTIVSATSLNTHDIKNRIPFGHTRHM